MAQQSVDDDEDLRIARKLITVHDPDWLKFQERYGKGQVSARIRELVREDLKRG